MEGVSEVLANLIGLIGSGVHDLRYQPFSMDVTMNTGTVQSTALDEARSQASTQKPNDTSEFDLLSVFSDSPDETRTPPSSQATTTTDSVGWISNLPDCSSKSKTQHSAMKRESGNSGIDIPSYELDAVNHMYAPRGDEIAEDRCIEREDLQPIQHNQEDDSVYNRYCRSSSLLSILTRSPTVDNNINVHDPNEEQLFVSDMAEVHSTQPTGIQSLPDHHTPDSERSDNHQASDAIDEGMLEHVAEWTRGNLSLQCENDVDIQSQTTYDLSHDEDLTKISP